ncbi:MAG: MATE family efflux transporter [Bacteroidetes bacterium]|nr:MATE family efflux transporter [Bacteroidota bacterium]
MNEGQYIAPKNEYANILKVSLPVSMALVIPFVNILANNYFLGKLGELELGTAGITGVFYLLLAMLGNGLHNAIQSIIARRTGEGRKNEIGRTFGQGMQISLAFAVLVILLTYLLLPLFLPAILKNQIVSAKALSFIYIRLWGIPFLYLFQLANCFFMGTTHSRFIVWGTIFQAGFNILLDYLLVFGNWGFPNLGFNGAAWASVIAEVIGFIVAWVVMYVRKFPQQFELFKHFKRHAYTIRLIIKTAAPLMAQYAISIFCWLLFYMLIEHQGERSLAISNLMRTLFSLTGIFIWAFASATNTLVSYKIGKGEKDQVIRLVHQITHLSLGICLCIFITLNVFASQAFEWFGLSDSFTQDGIPVLRIVSFAILFQSVAVVWLNAVTGTGDTRVNLLIEIAAIFFYGIYVYAVIEIYHLSLSWAWASEIIYWVFIWGFAKAYMITGKWRKLSY